MASSHLFTSNIFLGWAEHTAPTPQGWQCQARHRAAGFWGHQWPQRSSASYLLLLGTPFYLVLDWFASGSGTKMSDDVTAPLSRAIGGTYLGCASPAAQSHKAAAAQRVLIQLCASGPGAGEVWGHHWHCIHRRWGWKPAELSGSGLQIPGSVWKTQVWIRIH